MTIHNVAMMNSEVRYRYICGYHVDREPQEAGRLPCIRFMEGCAVNQDLTASDDCIGHFDGRPIRPSYTEANTTLALSAAPDG